MNTIKLLVSITTTLLFSAACQGKVVNESTITSNDQDVFSIHGSLVYAENTPLPTNGEATVTLNDVSLQDVSADVLAKQVIKLTDQKIPLPFSINVPRSAMSDHGRYSIRAIIRDENNRLLWTTDTTHLVDPNSSTQEDFTQLTLVRIVSFGAAAKPAVKKQSETKLDSTSNYQCSDTKIIVSFDNNDVAHIHIADQYYEAQRTISASGHKYESGSGENYILFWSKGKQARLQIGEEYFTDCTTVTF